MATHYMGLKPQVLPFIANGSKDLEIRVADSKRNEIRTGDDIVFNNQHRRRVVAIRRYSSFETMLLHEDSARILPGHSSGWILYALRGIYSPSAENLGVLVFEITM